MGWADLRGEMTATALTDTCGMCSVGVCVVWGLCVCCVCVHLRDFEPFGDQFDHLHPALFHIHA